MDAPSTDSEPLSPEAEPAEQTTPESPTKSYPKVELSPETRVFLHRMAENLRTHDPDVPKGRNRQY
ncbi:MAG TPA: hypothetical protein VGD78_06805 [Chthoniobacterales bacterium]